MRDRRADGGDGRRHDGIDAERAELGTGARRIAGDARTRARMRGRTQRAGTHRRRCRRQRERSVGEAGVRADVGGWYAFTSRLTAYLTVANALDRRYNEVVGYPALPINFRAGFRFRIGGE